MGKIYYMMGKSSSGKDTLQKELKEALPELKTITPYTTRPKRDGERNGVEYFFVSEDTLNVCITLPRKFNPQFLKSKTYKTTINI